MSYQKEENETTFMKDLISNQIKTPLKKIDKRDQSVILKNWGQDPIISLYYLTLEKVQRELALEKLKILETVLIFS